MFAAVSKELSSKSNKYRNVRMNVDRVACSRRVRKS